MGERKLIKTAIRMKKKGYTDIFKFIEYEKRHYTATNKKRREAWGKKGKCRNCGGDRPCKRCGDYQRRWRQSKRTPTMFCEECICGDGLHRGGCSRR